MNLTNSPRSENLREEQELWDLYREAMQEKGINIGSFYLAAVEQLKLSLPLPGARIDFVELISAGCSPEILGLLVALIRHSPRITELWERTVGQFQPRQKAKKDLERAAVTLETIFAPLLTADEETKKRLAQSKLLMPSQLISHLRLYVRLVTLGELLAADCGIRSLIEFVRYLLVGYVKRATGKFCDRNVSGLYGGVVGSLEYDVVAQRM